MEIQEIETPNDAYNVAMEILQNRQRAKREKRTADYVRWHQMYLKMLKEFPIETRHALDDFYVDMADRLLALKERLFR